MDTAVQVALIVLTVLGAGALAMFIARRGRTKGMGVVVLVSAMLTVVSGAVGWLQCSEKQMPEFGAAFANAIHFGAQNLLLNGESKPEDHWLMVVSRLLGMATVTLVAFAVIRGLFWESLDRAWIMCTRKHVVVCGIGQIGEEIARSAMESGKRVVVIERDEQNDRVDALRELGAMVVFGDATEKFAITQARVRSASHVYFCMGDDECNAEGVTDVVELLRTSRLSKPRLHCNMTNAELGRRLEQVGAANGCDVRAFDVSELAARDFLERKLSVLRVREDETIHFVVIGFGRMAQTLVLQIAELAHFPNLRRSRMTVVAEDRESDAVARFCARYPRVFGVPFGDAWKPQEDRDDWGWNVQVHERGAAGPGDRGVEFVLNGGFARVCGLATNPLVTDRLCELSGMPRVRPVVIVCGEGEDDNCAMAQRLRDELDMRIVDAKSLATPTRAYRDGFKPVPIFAFVPRRKTLGKVSNTAELSTFGLCREVCAHDRLSWQIEDHLAEVIYNGYHRNDSPAAPAFANALGWEKRSNRSAAAQVNLKLAPIGLRVERRKTTIVPVNPDEIPAAQRQVFAKIEHNRWLSERLIDGWSFGVRDNRFKLRHQIVNWENLPEKEQKKDDAQAAAVLEHCRESKECVLVRVDASDGV